MSTIRTGKVGEKYLPSVKQSNSISTILSKDRMIKPINSLNNNNNSPSLQLKINKNSPTVTTNRVNNASSIVTTPRSTVTNVTRKTNCNSDQKLQQTPNVRQMISTRRPVPVVKNNDSTNSLQPLKKLTNNNSPIVSTNSRVTPTSSSVITRKNVPVRMVPLSRREILTPVLLTRKATTNNTTIVHSNNNKASSVVHNDELLVTKNKQLTNINSSRGNESTRKQSKKVRASTLSCNAIDNDLAVASGVATPSQELQQHDTSGSSNQLDEQVVVYHRLDSHGSQGAETIHNPEIVQLKDDLHLRESEIGQANKQLDLLTGELETRNNEISKLREQLQNRDKNSENCDSEIVQLKNDLHLRNSKIEKLKESLNVRSVVIQTRNSEINKLKEELRGFGTLSAEISKLKEQQRILNENIENRDSEISKLREQRRNLDETVEARDSEISKLKEQQRHLGETVEARHSEISKLKEQQRHWGETVEARDSEIFKLKEQRRHLDENVDTHDLEISKLSKKLVLLEEDIKTRNSEIVQLKGDLNHRQSEIEQVNIQLHRLNGELETRNSEISKLNAEVQNRELHIVTRDQKIVQLKSQLQTEVSRLKLESDNQNKDHSINAEKLLHLKDVIEDQASEITSLKERTEQLEQKLVRQNGSIKNERIRMNGMESDVCIVVRCADERWMKAEMETKKAQKLKNEAEHKVEELEDKIESYEEDLALFRAILEQKPQMFDVGVQVNSASVRYGTENNNIQSISKDKISSKSIVSVSGEGDKENQMDSHNPVFHLANDDFENYKDIEKSVVIKPLTHASKRNSLFADLDPLGALAQNHGGSRRKALLAWSQQCTSGYAGVEIDDFSTCWSNGIAFCALLHSYLPSQIPFDSLQPENPEKNLMIAFKVAETIGVTMQLDIPEMLTERPSWQRVMNYLAEMYNCIAVL